MIPYIIQTKGLKVLQIAKDRDHAFAQFFKDVADERIPISELGNIIMLLDPTIKSKNDDDKQFPFRTVPILFQMKLLDKDASISNIMACTGVTVDEAEKMLLKHSFKDSRLLPIIEELRQEANR